MFVYEHARTLALDLEVKLLGTGLQTTDEELPGFVTVPAPRPRGWRRRITFYVRWLAAGLGPGPRIQRSLVQSPLFAAMISDCDVVELHYSQLAVLIPAIRRLRRDLPISVVCIDVYTQSLRRRRRHARALRYRLEAAIMLPRAQQRERTLLNKADMVCAFTAKDLTLLRQMGVRSELTLLTPYLQMPSDTTGPSGRPMVLFVGAMARSENDEAMLWWVQHVWPQIRLGVPEAVMTIAGAAPSRELRNRRAPDVIVTGEVSDLAPFYREAQVVVAPLLTGAGIKFKVGQALAYGLPVVATSIGAEGYEAVAGVHVCATAAELAAQTINLLRDDEGAKRLGAAGRSALLADWDFTRATHRHALRLSALVTGESCAP